jgi:hypothetical protein
MHSLEDLKTDTYYLVRLEADGPVQLVSVLMETKETVLLRSYIPSNEDFFVTKDLQIFQLIEELDEEKAEEFENIYAEEEEDEEKEELFEFEEDDEE